MFIFKKLFAKPNPRLEACWLTYPNAFSTANIFSLLSQLGFQFLSEDKHELNQVVLPDCWTLNERRTWKIILDQAGRERVTIGDNMWIVNRRFKVVNAGTGDGGLDWFVADGNDEDERRFVEHLNPIEHEECSVDGSGACEEWLDRHFPNWRDPLAYWD